MSDCLPLPPRPNLGQYKKLAKDLQRACKANDPAAIRAWAANWAASLARSHGGKTVAGGAQKIRWQSDRIVYWWARVQKTNPAAGRCTLTGAQFFLARAHGFASWLKFAAHLRALSRANSGTVKFEAAVDAIVSGDGAALRTLMQVNPKLVRARSERAHRSTLLHYVSANGVEDLRQRTPKNIVAITTMLLDAGADVNAESEAYGGGSTTLGLTATSCHPEEAGVQSALMDLLIQRGAMIERPDGGSAVNDCLHNGRGEAAEFLANRGARLDLEGAAGVGRLDLVRSFFNDDGRVKAPATQKQVKDAFAWACEFGRTAVVDFLLQRGIAIDAKLPHHGQIGLHWAAYGGHLDTVKLLLQRGAAVDARDEAFGGTPLQWALYQWGNSPSWAKRGKYHETVALLARAGAKLDAAWFDEDDEERSRALRKLRADARMQGALRGEDRGQ